MKILVIHGPNLAELGQREPEIYGDQTLEDINADIQGLVKSSEARVEIVQFDHEGDIVQKLAETDADAIVINAAAYTHTSVAIRDALKAIYKPAIEVHLSNIFQREEFRHTSMIAPVVLGQISGLGRHSYVLAVRYFIDYFSV